MPDVIYAGARVTTLDPDLPCAEALLVRGQRVVVAGNVATCRAAARPGCREVDLGGGWAVPGLTDCHVHLGWYGWSRQRLDLAGVRTVEEVQRRLAAYAATTPAGGWVFAGGWDPAALDRDAHRLDLDAHAGGRPVAIESTDLHSVWVNTAGLRLLGVHGTDPPGGRVERDAEGPTGVLRENATAGVRALVTERIAADGAALLRAGFADLLAYGVTSVHDIDGYAADPAYRALRDAGELPVRVHRLISRDHLDEAVDAGVATGDGDRWLSTGPVKLFADGALGSHTAALLDPYEDTPHDRGVAVAGVGELAERIGFAARAGIASAVHAIGDAANRAVLDAVAAVRRQRVGEALRHRIEHAQHVAWDDVPRFAALGVVPSMQPLHRAVDAALVEELLGGRPLASYAWAELTAAGARVAFGSDLPVVSVDPVAGIQAAVATVDPLRALHGYTTGAAYASGEETVKGRLAPGHLADLTVFDADLTDLDVAGSGQATARVTVVGGEVRWSA